MTCIPTHNHFRRPMGGVEKWIAACLDGTYARSTAGRNYAMRRLSLHRRTPRLKVEFYVQAANQTAYRRDPGGHPDADASEP